MELIVYVTLKHGDVVHRQAVAIADPYAASFEPLCQSDDRMLGALAGEPTDVEARAIVKMRKHVAADIAAALSGELMVAMKKEDTYNGYPIIKE